MAEFKTEKLANGNIKVIIPITVESGGAGKRITTADGRADEDTRKILLTAIARGRRWQQYLDNNDFSNIAGLAKRIGRDVSYVARIIRISQVAPAIIRSIIDNNYPAKMSLNFLETLSTIPEWEEQEHQAFLA